MIKKLKQKFIFINMLSISTILIVVLCMIGISSYTRQMQETNDTLTRTMNEFDHPLPKKIEIGKPKDGAMKFNPSATFSITLDNTGTILNTYTDSVSITADTLSEAARIAFSSSKSSGAISSLNLHYLKENVSGEIRIVFVDTESQMQAFRNLIFTLFIVAVCGLLAFLFISMWLARWSVRPVEEAWERQRQFIADASHELKTPLTVILANTGIILNHKTDTVESQQKWIAFIKEEAEHMKKLVEDMLFLAKADASKLPALTTELNMSDLVWSALLPFESVAFESGLLLETEIAPNIKMQGNESQLKQLIGIMVDNACKYADKKGTVTVRFYKSDKVHLSFHNTGTSITPEQQKHLFERFYRTDESRDRKAGGFGLGLSIAKSIADNHHAQFQIKSSPETGTTFDIIF